MRSGWARPPTSAGSARNNEDSNLCRRRPVRGRRRHGRPPGRRGRVRARGRRSCGHSATEPTTESLRSRRASCANEVDLREGRHRRPACTAWARRLCAIRLIDDAGRRSASRWVNVGDSRDLPVPRRDAHPAQRGPQPGRGPRARRPAHRGPRPVPPAAQHRHPGPRHRRRRRGRLGDRRSPPRRPLPPLQRRPVQRGRREPHRRRAAPAGRTRTTRATSWCGWPTSTADATTSPWWWSTSSTTAAGRRPRSAALAGEPTSRCRSRRRPAAAGTTTLPASPTADRTRPDAGDATSHLETAASSSTTSTGRTAKHLTWRVACSHRAAALVSARRPGRSAGTPATPTSSAFAGGEVTIFRGRPGGLLWFDPTVEQRTGIKRAEVPAGPAGRDRQGQGRRLRRRRPPVRRQHAGPDHRRPPQADDHTTPAATTTTRPAARPTTHRRPRPADPRFHCTAHPHDEFADDRAAADERR